jgi:predicted double-glycine peptidase
MTNGNTALTALLSSLLIGICSMPLTAGPHTFFGGIGENATVQVTSFKAAKYRSVIKQQYDFSCGSAALATLLTYHYDKPTTEEDTFDAMYQAGDQEKIRQKGFSLLDMKHHLARLGLRSDGYRMPMSKVADLGVPAIVLINTGGYKHFVVVKGIRDRMVLVGDPAKGVTKIPESRFEEMSEGIVLLIKDEARVARASFNNAADWSITPKAPLHAIESGMGSSNFSLTLPSAGEF